MRSAYLLRKRGWVSVTAGIVSKRPNLKLFRPSGSTIREAFGTPCADTKFKGNPFTGAFNTRGVGKIGDFRRILPFISETVRDSPMVTMER